MLRELTNIPLNLSNGSKKSSHHYSESSDSSEETDFSLPLEKVLKVGLDTIKFGECLPKTIHEKTFSIEILENLPSFMSLKMFIVNEDEELNKEDHLVFGINREGEKQYFEDYAMEVSKKGKY